MTAADRRNKPENRTELIWKHFKQKVSAQPTTTLRNKISVQHRKIVQKIAHDYAKKCRVAYEDLEQIGMIGMLKAVEKFDPTKGVAFSSFATPYVRGEILHHLRDSGSNVKIPRRDRELNSKANRLAREWVVVKQTEPTEQELADLMGVSVEKLQSVRESVAYQHACEYNEDYDEIPAPESYALHAEQHQGLEQTWKILRQRVQALPESERDLITKVFCYNVSTKALGKSYNLTASAVQSKLERVLIRLAQ
jgi:RNA polymerase sigma-B factor